MKEKVQIVKSGSHRQNGVQLENEARATICILLVYKLESEEI